MIPDFELFSYLDRFDSNNLGWYILSGELCDRRRGDELG